MRLGDYVHLLYKNYKTYGTNPYGTRGETLDTAIKNYQTAMRNRINKDSFKVSSETIQTLKMRLKENATVNIEDDNKRLESYQQKWLDELYKFLISRLKISNRSFSQQPISKFLKQSNNIWKTSNTLDELKKLRQQAQTKLKDITEQISNIKKHNYVGDLEKLKKLYNSYADLAYLPKVSGIQAKSVIGAIEAAMSKSLFDNGNSAIIGNFGELVSALCDDTASNIAIQQINQIVEKFFEEHVKGAQESSIELNKDLIAQNFVPTWMIDPKDGNIYKANRPTKDKVDVEIKVGGSDVYASIKATSLDIRKEYQKGDQIIVQDPYIRHLQDVNLFYTLAFLNSEQGFQNIGNHWLNIHTGLEDNDRNIFELDDIIKTEVAIQALVIGNPLKQNVNSANVFIYINMAKGEIYVASVNDILNTALGSTGFSGSDSELGGFEQDPDLSTIKINNEKKDNIDDRISDILNILHQHKIRVSYQIPIFTNEIKNKY